MSSESPKGSKVNTLLISMMMVMVSIVGWFASQSATKADTAASGVAVLQSTVSRIEGNVMPRPEIQVQLDALKLDINKLSLQIVELQSRQMKFEVELAQHGMILDRDYSKKLPEREK